MKSKSYPCKHPRTARRELKGIPPAFRCAKCGRDVEYASVEDQYKSEEEEG